MAILDKLLFWRKKEEFDLGGLGPLPGEEKAMPGAAPPFGKELGPLPGLPEEPTPPPTPTPGPAPLHEIPEEPTGPAFGAPPGPPPTAPPPGYMPPPQITSRDIELLSAKLDAIRATLENINQRLINIERIAKRSEHETY